MNISVIIPCLNTEQNIYSVLKSLAQQSILPEEVIVVDNGSRDQTVRKTQDFINTHKELNVVLSAESKKGAAAARNKGIGMAKGDIMAFIDSDCIADRDWIRNIKAAYSDSATVAVGGQILGYEPTNLVEKVQSIDEAWVSEKPMIKVERRSNFMIGNLLATCNCSYRRDVLEKLGKFNESFLIGEDADLYLRLLEKISPNDKVLVQQQGIKIWHKPRHTFFQLAKQIFSYRVALARLIKTHLRGTVVIDLPKFGIFELPRFPLTIWIYNPGVKFILFILMYPILGNSIFYFLPLLLAALLAVTYKKKDALGLKISAQEMVLIMLISLIKKIISEAGKVYGSIKYGIICL